MNSDPIQEAAAVIAAKKNLLIFTGAGVSVESGIPPFRGAGGLWQKVNPDFFDIDHFMSHPVESWKRIRSIFYFGGLGGGSNSGGRSREDDDWDE